MTAPTAIRIPLTVLSSTGIVIFFANAGLLVLQLLAGRYLAPFIGSSVETWTSVIAVFLTGIALGNHWGGKLADRYPSTRTLGILLVLGGISSLSMIACWQLCQNFTFYQSIPLTPRIPILATMFCLPPAIVLSLITPLTIKLALSDVKRSGQVAGLVFALSTLGCLLGNYVTGFWLMADYTLNAINLGVSLGLFLLSIPMFLVKYTAPADANAASSKAVASTRPDLRNAYVIVFLASFCGMSLELTASRLLAPVLGVSIYSWTGIIGVMLAGTAIGNYLGGILADKGPGPVLRRLSVFLATLLGYATFPAILRSVQGIKGAPDVTPILERIVGASLAMVTVLSLIKIQKFSWGPVFNLFLFGGVIGTAIAPTVGRSILTVFSANEKLQEILNLGPLVVHILGFAAGGGVALLFRDNTTKQEANIQSSLTLSTCLFLAGLLILLILITSTLLQRFYFMTTGNLISSILVWTFALFFLPMMALGTISPQVIRMNVPDMAQAGRIAGSIYAWSTVGAIVGTLVTGYFLIAFAGMYRVLMILAFTLTILALCVGRLWKNNAMLYGASIVAGGAIVGLMGIGYGSHQFDLETKYYAIKVFEDKNDLGRPIHKMALDLLVHSYVDLDDPTWLGYTHEEVQGELVRLARDKAQSQNQKTEILVIGGGGYTFPRWVETLLPDVGVDVVEIDPGVTEVAHRSLGLSRKTKIRSIHMDGRQYVAAVAPRQHYQLVIQDAVNDLSVPYHLMTKEYNDVVKQTLTPDGAFLLTLIDPLDDGELWRAAVNTMRETFKHVELLDETNFRNTERRHVYVIYGADHPLDMKALRRVVEQSRQPAAETAVVAASPMGALAWQERRYWTHSLAPERLNNFLDSKKKLILTDQYAPVDNLMSEVFRSRAKTR